MRTRRAQPRRLRSLVDRQLKRIQMQLHRDKFFAGYEFSREDNSHYLFERLRWCSVERTASCRLVTLSYQDRTVTARGPIERQLLARSRFTELI